MSEKEFEFKDTLNLPRTTEPVYAKNIKIKNAITTALFIMMLRHFAFELAVNAMNTGASPMPSRVTNSFEK